MQGGDAKGSEPAAASAAGEARGGRKARGPSSVDAGSQKVRVMGCYRSAATVLAPPCKCNQCFIAAKGFCGALWKEGAWAAAGTAC